MYGVSHAHSGDLAHSPHSRKAALQAMPWVAEARGFCSLGAAQQFISAFSGISPHFRPRRHLMTAPDYRAEMTVRFAIWEQITGVTGQPTAA